MAVNRNEDLAKQAMVFSRYLINEQPSKQEVSLYTKFLKDSADSTDPLLDFAVAHPWSAGCLDGYAALFDTDSELRRRILVMFAILEASPDHVDCFLPKKRVPLYLLVLLYHALQASLRTIAGVILAGYVRLAA